MTIHEALVIRIKQLMKEHNVNQTTLSKLTGIPKSTLNNMLNNRTTNTSSSNLIKFAKAFNIRVQDLIGNDIFDNLEPPISKNHKNKH